MSERHDIAIVGGGILGLATAMALTERYPGVDVIVIEKEDHWAAHQTGHNSGVIHSGIYYKPGSLKAQYCKAGNKALVEFCQEHGIAHDICGKVIVATERDELERMETLYERAVAHGLTVNRLGPNGIADVEPHVTGIAALHLPSTGIIDFKAVTATYARLVQARGGTLRLGTRVTGLSTAGAGGDSVIETDKGEIRAGFVVNCAGLHSDRVARLGGVDPKAKIVPFRGEYYELTPARRHLVKSLIYPVPDPSFPFLGVHYTRMIDGTVHAGPNAVLALKREGYRKRDFDRHDTVESLTYSGFWKLARKHWADGSKEVARSLSKTLFLRSLQRLIPEVRRGDLVPTHAGVRAQALTPDGALVDDFLIVDGPRSLHVCNAPSPAATSSLEIGRAVAARVPVTV
ncbi:MAG: L-2-hydroxyglutarate oxidase [Acidimicrobiia bacterium]